MATQHPDNAQPAYWNGKKFINTLDEVEECHRMFDELKCTEYMWDWEGKFVDEAVVEKLYQKYHSFFQKKKLGKDVRAFSINGAYHELLIEKDNYRIPVITTILDFFTNSNAKE